MAHNLDQSPSKGEAGSNWPDGVVPASSTPEEELPKAKSARRGSKRKKVTPGEVPGSQVVHLTALEAPEDTFAGPTVRLLFSNPDEAQRIARLALALDSIGASSLPLLLDEANEGCAGLDGELDLVTALSQVAEIPTIKTFTIGGGPAAVIGLAAGEVTQTPTGESDLGANGVFLTALAARHYIDPVTIQSLREVRSSAELLQLLNRRRLGWLFDEVCRLACLEVRKRLSRPATLETIAFGHSGALLGRAVIEPGNFEI
jgi:hypothetical protein